MVMFSINTKTVMVLGKIFPSWQLWCKQFCCVNHSFCVNPSFWWHSETNWRFTRVCRKQRMWPRTWNTEFVLGDFEYLCKGGRRYLPPSPSALSTDGVFACVRFLGRGSAATPDTCQLKQSQIIQVFAVPFVLLSFLHRAGLTLKITYFSREDFQSHLTLVNLLTVFCICARVQ